MHLECLERLERLECLVHASIIKFHRAAAVNLQPRQAAGALCFRES
jgi:hypothetical protein